MENIPQVPGKRAKVGQDHDARKAVLSTLPGLKRSGAIFRPKSSKPSERSFYMCLFFCKPKASGVTLENPGVKNIPQVPANRGKDGQDLDA